MPPISQHQSTNAVKLLLVGDTGAGKTTALASLANAGFRLFIQDYDNGLDALRHFIKPDKLGNVFFKTFIDPRSDINGRIEGIPQAVQKGFAALDNWVEELGPDEELPPGATLIPGPPAPPVIAGAPLAVGQAAKPAPHRYSMGSTKTWGGNDVLVIDSLTFFGQACMNYALALNGRLGQRPTMADWGDAIRMQENTLSALYADSIKCNVVITAHLAFQEEMTSGGLQKGYPSALGSKLPPKVGRYFNSMLLVESAPAPAAPAGLTPIPGAAAPPRMIRQLRTRSTTRIELKAPSPNIPETIPIDLNSDKPSGLAAYIRMVQG